MKRRNIINISLPIASLGLLALSLIIAKAYELVTPKAVITSGAFILCLLFALNWLVLAYNKTEHRADIERILSRLREIVPPPNYTWLYEDKDLAKAESEAKGNSIWIVSPDLKNVIDKEEIREVVRKNIKRGITYTYIIPDSETVKGILPGLMELSKSNPKRLKVISVPESEFRFLTVTHIAIFNATMVGGEIPDVFIELPIQEAEGNRIRGYWIRMSKGAASGMVGRFRNIIDK